MATVAELLRARVAANLAGRQKTAEADPALLESSARDACAPTEFASTALVALLSAQYTKELLASETYQGISVYMDDIGLTGFAKYFKKGADEERGHAMRFRDFIVNDLNARMTMAAIPEVKVDYASPVTAFEAQMLHEKSVTQSIQAINDAAVSENNFYVIQFTQTMLKEQMEEEDRAYTDLLRIRLAGDGAGLLILDHELGG